MKRFALLAATLAVAGFLAACGLVELGGRRHPGREEDELEQDPLDAPIYTRAELEEMLGIIQILDPPGVGARSLAECLALQAQAAALASSTRPAVSTARTAAKTSAGAPALIWVARVALEERNARIRKTIAGALAQTCERHGLT